MPPAGTVRFHFGESEHVLTVTGPVNELLAPFRYQAMETTMDEPEYEEGSLTVAEIRRERHTGPYITYEELLTENLGLTQGYYIKGAKPLESVLTIFGGHGREEIILFELQARALPE